MRKKITKVIKKIGLIIKGIYLDSKWYKDFNCYEIYPPSFYLIHTEEEVKRIIEEDFQELEELIKRYRKERCPD